MLMFVFLLQYRDDMNAVLSSSQYYYKLLLTGSLSVYHPLINYTVLSTPSTPFFFFCSNNTQEGIDTVDSSLDPLLVSSCDSIHSAMELIYKDHSAFTVAGLNDL